MNHVECVAQVAEAQAGWARALADLDAAVGRVDGLRVALGEAESARDEWMARAKLAEEALASTVSVAEPWRVEREELAYYDFSSVVSACRPPSVVSQVWARRGSESMGPFLSVREAVSWIERRTGQWAPLAVRRQVWDEIDADSEHRGRSALRVDEQCAEDEARGVL